MYPIPLIVIPGALIASIGLMLPRELRMVWILSAAVSSLWFYLSTRDFDGGSPFDGAMGISVMTVVIFGVIAVVKAMGRPR